MLIRSKDSHDKIVMGLLSYSYGEENPSMTEQKEILDKYREDDRYEIYLYRPEESDNYIGVVVIEIDQNKDKDDVEHTTLIVHRIAMLPSFRNEGYGYSLYRELRQKYPDATIIGTITTTDLIAEWTSRYYQ